MAKLFRPKVLSTYVLSALAVVALVLFYWAISSRDLQKQAYYEKKLEAAKLMQNCMEFLKEYRLEGGKLVDPVNDPNQTGLIGEKYSVITTDAGNLDSKLTTTNPNFAALIVQFLKKAKVKKGDYVAVSFTGSMPTVNIAVLSALKVMQLQPVIITSVGASMWGANDPEFTWLDMAAVLREQGLLEYKSVAASLGGGSDIGRRLSKMGRNLLKEAIDRNGIQFIHERNLDDNIQKRMSLYFDNLEEEQEFAAFINVGGGAVTVGHNLNSRLIPNGLIKNLMKRNYPSNGVIIEFGRRNIPIIHLLKILEIAEKYNLEIAPEPLPEVGKGALFEEQTYNLLICWIALITLVIILTVIILKVRRDVGFPYL